jgi:Zn-dependent protease with chaperone function
MSGAERSVVWDRTDFFDEQARRRRAAGVFSIVCLVIASGIGVVLSSVVTPLLLLAGGGLLRGLARLGVFPTALRNAAHALGSWAAGHVAHFQAVLDSLDHVNHVGDLGVTVAPLLRLAPVAVPALMAAGLVWLVLRRLSLKGEASELVGRLRGRAPNPQDLEEHQLANIVAEMAIAAGLPGPAVFVIDSTDINAAAVGGSRGGLSVLVSRGLLDQLDRDETSGVIAHLVASIGAGDVRLTHSVLAVFQTFGFFVTFLDLPFRWSAWTALGGLGLVAVGLRTNPNAVATTLEAVERGVEAEAMPDVERVWSVIPYPWMRKVLLVPLLPLVLVSLILRLVLFLWTALFLGPPLAMIWRNRRYASDAMAVQLTRNPDALARALGRLEGMPEGGEGREYCFIHGSASPSRRRIAPPRTTTRSLHPPLGHRVARVHALGAGGSVRRRTAWVATMTEHPGRALLVTGLLLLLVPLFGALVLMVFYLTAIAMTMGLGLGLTVAAGLLA